MSRQRALEAIAGRHSDRVAQCEFIAHEALFRKVSGLDPYEKPLESYLAYLDRYDLDASLIGEFGPPALREGQQRREGKHVITSWGLSHTAWLADPLYKTPDEILAFDPRTHDPSSLQQKIDSWCDAWERVERCVGDRLLWIPGHYQLVLHYMPFYCDWSVFMETLITRPADCLPLLDRCTEYTLDVFRAFAATPAPVVVAHEDLCSARGPIFNPAFLRREVFPRFARIYEPCLQAGKKVLAVSDGLIESIAPDLLAAGASGLFLEPHNDLSRMIDLVGPAGLILGGADSRILTTGTPRDVDSHVQAAMAHAKALPGFLFCLGGQAPNNVPLENLETYFAACRRYGKK
ncbi:MAG: hypothetical protein NTV86_08845 [Planctomycetota bacterium]|nr:hypothetical protein [Planctomycetota bacterium]